MKIKTILSIAVAVLTVASAHAGNQRVFSTETELEATSIANQYFVLAKVSELTEKKNEVVERTISAPRMGVIVGHKSSIKDTLGDGTVVSIDVTWPTNFKGDKEALIVVTHKHDKKLLSRSKVTVELKSE